MKKSRYDTVNLYFFGISFFAAVTVLITYSILGAFTWFHLGIFVGMFSLTLLSISGGYHRLYAHRSYEGPTWLKLFYLLFGAAAFEQTALKWATEHRIHHRFVDTDTDPYNIKKGFYWAHIGWILERDPVQFEVPKDLLADRLLIWQKKYWMLIAILFGFGFPTLIGYIFGDPLGGLCFGGIVRLVAAHHCTFMINSLAHTIGSATYTEDNTARDSWITAIFTFGEGYHNYHHWSPSDYRNGVRSFHWDPPKWFILGLSWIGQAWDLKRTNEEDVVKARAQMQMKQAQTIHHTLASKLHVHFDHLSKSVEELSKRRKEWAQAKREMIAYEAEGLRIKFHEARRQFKLAKRAWKNQISAIS